MLRREGLAALVLVAALTGCSGGRSAGPPPQGLPTASGGSSDAAAGPLRQLFRGAVKPLLDQQVIDFDHTIYSGKALAVQTTGRAFQQVGWESTTSSPKQLGSARAPQGDDVKGRMDVRAVGADLFMRLSTWTEPLAGCWLRTSGDQVPGGQLAMTPGVPGYVTVLGAVRPEAVVDQSGDDVTIGGEVPLRVGLQMFTTGVLGLLQLDASQLDGASVPVGVLLHQGVVAELDVTGRDLVGAVRAAGGDLAPDAEATVSQLQVAVAYHPGPQDADPVSAPASGQVMTNADVKAEHGCSAP